MGRKSERRQSFKDVGSGWHVIRIGCSTSADDVASDKPGWPMRWQKSRAIYELASVI